jgi:hypothetical protein
VHSEFSVLRIYKGYTYIRVEDGRQFVFNELRNYNYDPPSFYQLINKGDMVMKDAGSNTVTIYARDSGRKYTFELTGDVPKDGNVTPNE